MNTEATNVKIVSKPALTATLKALPLGKPKLIKNKQFKANVVRNTISRLNKKGYSFEATEDGLVDAVQVTRIK
ncbi:lysylphosphatidylglycerol synthetase-like protein (DUF2156 family) [Dysgonomonas sp. PH5-45]|uniref:hypothetical protein n=1 Tax=unclassified Dysgonomonas TaxID=2630389 RepID=UPI002473262F|nr:MULTISPECIES: hypothetical protein [unclassified Dysgonomonas]MDH6354681.1 lysylphosphatidylglycerol synthetase-like protein (DUF2156 family) [Dysgonomonas sp. PH5-45]MDH6387578.1 lysylphosphatidylglycerol synthetase-like protein (DUF2156 family) [Dysgonomonas sp. PH5-37]